MDKILDFEVFPVLIGLICMNNNNDIHFNVLNLVTRLFNQRYEFIRNAKMMLLLFDDNNIKVYQYLQTQILILAKNVDESEVWIKDLENPHNK